MSFDIYGNTLRSGHCEVHPHVHEEFPCSVCMAESAQREQKPQYCDGNPAVCESAYCLGQASEHIRDIEAKLVSLTEALETLILVVGLTPIAGNKEALQEAVDSANALLGHKNENN